MELKTLGPYAIGEPLGKGGMGAVYRATHAERGEAVAVKVLSPHLAASEGFRERFEAEIDSLQTLRHAGIVRLHGYGEQDGVLFYVMELVEGPSLEEELRRGRRFTWRETVQIAIQVSRALKHAHDHGVVHRDVKPANLLLTPRGDIKIADFGIARLFGSTGVTVAGGVLGTADYMSPEQASGEPVSARCDQYSLGCVMYALLAGRPPFRARDLPTMLQLQRYAVPEPVRRYAPDTPEELDQTVLQLLEKNPKDRFPNTMVLARHLEAMSRALARPGADDFELYEPPVAIALATPEDAQANEVTRVATGAAAPGSSAFVGATTPSVSLLRLPTHLQSSPGERAPTAPPLPATRYTVVEEDEDDTPSPWRQFASQAAVLLVALGTLGAAAWWWTLPLGAEALYERLEARHERGGADSALLDGVAEFLARFPDDPRVEEVASWERAIELARIKKRLALSRLGANVRGEQSAAEEMLFQRARDLAARDPAAGAAAMQALAGLLGAGAAPDSSAAAYAAVAEAEASDLRERAREQQRHVTALLRERLTTAKRLRTTDPAAATRILHGLLGLVERTEATAPLLDEARALLATPAR